MRRYSVLAAATLCALSNLDRATVPAGDVRAAAPLIHTGLMRTMFKDAPDPLIRVMASAFEALMREQTGLASDVCIADSPDDLTGRLKEGKLDVGAYYGFQFAWARQGDPDLKALMIAVKDQSFCRACVVVHQDCPLADAAALKGKTLAVPLLTRAHCRLFLRRRCVPTEMPPEKWYAKVTTPRTDRDALDDVADGSTDAALVDDVDLVAFRKAFPKTGARLRVLQQSEVFPATVIAYRTGTLNDETLRRLRQGMIAAKTTERGRKMLALFHLTGFEEVPADYERTVADIAKAYPPPGK